jgi:hypothetical protein
VAALRSLSTVAPGTEQVAMGGIEQAGDLLRKLSRSQMVIYFHILSVILLLKAAARGGPQAGIEVMRSPHCRPEAVLK